MPIAPRNTSGGTGSLSADLTASKGAGASQRHRFRSDLKVMPADVEGSSDMRIVDPVSGRDHRFTAAEFFLCQAADGETSLSAIRERYAERFGQDIDSRQLNTFYRRLRAEGLLVKSDAMRAGAAEDDASEDPAGSERARLSFQGERRTSQRIVPRRIAGKANDEPTEAEETAAASEIAAADIADYAPATMEPAPRASQRVTPRRIAGKANGEPSSVVDTQDGTAAPEETGPASMEAPAAAEPTRRASQRIMPRRVAGRTNGEPATVTEDAAAPDDNDSSMAAAAPVSPEPALPPATLPAPVTFDEQGETTIAGPESATSIDRAPDSFPELAAPTVQRDAPADVPEVETDFATADDAAAPVMTAIAELTAPVDETNAPDVTATAASAPAAAEPVSGGPSEADPAEPQASALPPASEGALPSPEPMASPSPLLPEEPEAAEPASARPRVTPNLAKRPAKPRPPAKSGPQPGSLPRANIRVRPTTGDDTSTPATGTLATMRSLPPPDTDPGARRPAGAAPPPAGFDPNAFLGEMEDDEMLGGHPADGPAGRMARRRRPGAEAAGAGTATAGGTLAGPGGMAGAAGAGFGGGLGGGGFGGGGFGGGGFGGGGMGGGMGGGGRGEALLAALAARGRPGGGAAATPAPPRDRVSLFNPMGFYWALNILFWPMRYLHWLLWPMVAFTFFVIYQRWSDLTLDVFKTSWTWSTIALMLVSFLIVNLVARTTQGVTIRAFGGQVRQFGLIVEFGFLPRFFIDRTDIPTMDRRGQLYCYAAPLVSRLWLWSGGMLIWASQHGAGNNLHDYALVISHAALIEFLCVAFPLLPSDGMNWLLTWFGDPGLKKKAIVAFKAWVTGQPRPFFIKQEEEAGLVLFAVGAILCSFLFVFGLLTYFGIMLGSGLGGTGAVVFLGLCLGCALWMYGVFRNGGKNRGAMTLRDLGLGPQDDTADEEARANDPAKVKERVSIAAWGRVIWAFVIVFLIAVAFLPYDYEASGQFEILPNARNQANAQTDGEIEKILVREGDWVKPGELLGQLSSWDQEHEVAITKARLAEAKAKLVQVQEGSKSEAITVAEKEVESQKATVAFTEAEMKRQQELEKTGTASPAAYERAKSKYDNDVAKLNVAVANLALVKSSATQAELDARQADVERLTAELAYNQSQFERTRIRATAEGRVITPNLHLLVGKWLRSGNPLLETENTKTVDAEIGVPESDIALVAPGDAVRIKAWGYSDREIPGKVVSIAPAADKRSYGMVVRTKATIPNEDGALRSQMTGYAKIEGDNMMVWQAFLRFIVRFFQVEVWSWIP